MDANNADLPGEHPLRRSLSHEVHARPFIALHAPLRATHLALLTGESGATADHACLCRLCERFGVDSPDAGAIHAIRDFGDFQLRWERHTEFCSYTFFVPGELPGDPFSARAIDFVPRDWVAGLPDDLLVAVNVVMNPAGATAMQPAEIGSLMGTTNFAASSVAGGSAETFMDFGIDHAGFGRVFIQDRSLGPYQAGRLVQRLLEIETYRVLALLALPVAREQGGELSDAQGRLAQITGELNDLDSLEDERRLLEELTRIAQDIEALAASGQYRFGAASAYYGLVQRRIAELREERVEGFQNFAEFIDRRLTPAMHTCEAVDRRRDRLARDLARAVDLLHTRVNVQVEAQNRDLLASMDQRSGLQMRLQQTVEGLSVAAITYYTVSLVGYASNGMEAAGLGISPPHVTALSIPVIALAVWYTVRRIRRHIERRFARAG